MAKIANEEYVEYLKNKHFGFMSRDKYNKVEVTRRGFEYKGELLVAVKNLLVDETSDLTPVKIETSKVEEKPVSEIIPVIKDEKPVVEPNAVDENQADETATDESKSSTDETSVVAAPVVEEPKVEEKSAPKKSGRPAKTTKK